MSSNALFQEEEELEMARARERDLLAIIATKDKRIQQLEEKLEAQSKFINAALELSENYKDSKQRSRRKVSFCESVDELEGTRRTLNEITVDSGQVDEDDMDDLSVLSGDERVQEQSGSTSSTEDESDSEDSEPNEPVFVKPRNRRPTKAESKLVQAIIEKIRDDSDSVTV